MNLKELNRGELITQCDNYKNKINLQVDELNYLKLELKSRVEEVNDLTNKINKITNNDAN